MFAEGYGFQATSATTNLITGTLSDYSVSYFTSGTRVLEGIHKGRDSLVLAHGTAKDLKKTVPTKPGAGTDSSKLPPEFAAIGASLQPAPGMIIYPGTESRYVMEGFGTPKLEPIYVSESVLNTRMENPR